MKQAILVLGYGNPSRGDDAVGPLLLEAIAEQIDLQQVELITDFQLQIEHALDLTERDLVLFVDASVGADNGITFQTILAGKDSSYSTHAMSPAAVLDVYQSITKQQAPPCFMLTIKAQQFELGAGLSEVTEAYFQQACQFVLQLLKQPRLQYWQQQLT